MVQPPFSGIHQERGLRQSFDADQASRTAAISYALEPLVGEPVVERLETPEEQFSGRRNPLQRPYVHAARKIRPTSSSAVFTLDMNSPDT
jgi:hypothetical protein